jgi:hypothetical protein
LVEVDWLFGASMWIALPLLALFLFYYRAKGGKSTAPYFIGLGLVVGLLALVIGNGIADWGTDSTYISAAVAYGLLPGLAIVMVYYAIKSKQSFTAYYCLLAATLFILIALFPMVAADWSYPGGGWYAVVNYAWPHYWASLSPEFALLAIAASLLIVVPRIARTRATRSSRQE